MHQCINPSFPLQFMLRVLALARTILFQLDLGSAAGDSDLGSVVEIVALGTLQPRHFAVFFCHDSYILIAKLAPGRDPGLNWVLSEIKIVFRRGSWLPHLNRRSCRLRERRSG